LNQYFPDDCVGFCPSLSLATKTKSEILYLTEDLLSTTARHTAISPKEREALYEISWHGVPVDLPCVRGSYCEDFEKRRGGRIP
jgi:hypothetical protein